MCLRWGSPLLAPKHPLVQARIKQYVSGNSRKIGDIRRAVQALCALRRSQGGVVGQKFTPPYFPSLSPLQRRPVLAHVGAWLRSSAG